MQQYYNIDIDIDMVFTRIYMKYQILKFQLFEKLKNVIYRYSGNALIV